MTRFALLVTILALPLTGSGQVLFVDSFEQPTLAWALEESFTADPAAPSTAALPNNFDFVVTHRTHPRNHEPAFASYPADHDETCAGPVPESISGRPEPQHLVRTRHNSNGQQPDESFFICKNHMMSSMGDVEGYSVTSFYPRQAFDFADGGVLEFDVNINDGHPRSWWEILITPHEQLKVGAANSWLPIDETYPRDRIVLEFSANSRRRISVGATELAPDGWLVDEDDWRDWRFIDATDPALDDRRIRRQMRVELDGNEIRWGVRLQDGSYDWFAATVPAGLPFTRGLVLFKTHAYTPQKDDNNNLYTYHWDNLRFSGPVVDRFDVFEADELVYLQANGSRPIGTSESTSINLPAAAWPLDNPRLFGQLHGAMTGQVELSINGGPFTAVDPQDYDNGCNASGWSSFLLPLNTSQLVPGDNQFTWRIGPRAPCVADWVWDGFSVKSLEIQVDR